MSAHSPPGSPGCQMPRRADGTGLAAAAMLRPSPAMRSAASLRLSQPAAVLWSGNGWSGALPRWPGDLDARERDRQQAADLAIRHPAWSAAEAVRLLSEASPCALGAATGADCTSAGSRGVRRRAYLPGRSYASPWTSMMAVSSGCACRAWSQAAFSAQAASWQVVGCSAPPQSWCLQR